MRSRPTTESSSGGADSAVRGSEGAGRGEVALVPRAPKRPRAPLAPLNHHPYPPAGPDVDGNIRGLVLVALKMNHPRVGTIILEANRMNKVLLIAIQ